MKTSGLTCQMWLHSVDFTFERSRFSLPVICKFSTKLRITTTMARCPRSDTSISSRRRGLTGTYIGPICRAPFIPRACWDGYSGNTAATEIRSIPVLHGATCAKGFLRRKRRGYGSGKNSRSSEISRRFLKARLLAELRDGFVQYDRHHDRTTPRPGACELPVKPVDPVACPVICTSEIVSVARKVS